MEDLTQRRHLLKITNLEKTWKIPIPPIGTAIRPQGPLPRRCHPGPRFDDTFAVPWRFPPSAGMEAA